MMDSTIIKNAILANYPAPTPDQISAAGALADAIKTMVEGMTITYTTGLVDASGPVTGAFGCTIN